MTLQPGTVVGPYRVGGLLGRGGMAAVYEATHEAMGRTVALKLVSADLADPTFAERFRREGRMQAALDHPNAVGVYEAGDSELGPYLAMRLVRGTTLAGLIDGGALTSARALDLLEQVAGALDAAHAAGLVHRDVKPRNVLVDDDDHAFLADFGLTRPGDVEGVTAAGQFMGTIAYAAPEVVTGEAGGPAADRYALAAVLFECLSGTTVFPRPTQSAVVYAHAHEPPPRLSGRRDGIPAALDEVLINGLAKDPSERPATAAELIARARGALAGIELGPPAPRSFSSGDDETTAGQVTRPVAPVSPPVPRSRRTISAAALAGVAVGAAAVAVAVAAIGADDETPAAAVVPPAPAGSVRLGSSLAQAGRTVDCRGKAVTPQAPGCTVFQARLADTTLVVPRNGVVRRWSVRSARGELALEVLRRRDNGYFQTSRSRTEFVNDARPQSFATDLLVERGDRLGLVAIGGSGVGLRAAAGATTSHWIPSLRGEIRPERPGEPGELLLQADYIPGGRQRLPEQIVGAEAAAAPAGATQASAPVRFGNGVKAELLLVVVDGRGWLDLIRAGRRRARIAIDDLVLPLNPGTTITPYVAEGAAERVDLDLQFSRVESQRMIGHYLVFNGRRFVFIN